MRLISLITILLILPLASSLPLSAEDGSTVTIDLSAVELPASVERTEAALDERLAELAEQYRAAVEKARSDAIKSLERDRSRTRDAMVAMAIQTRIDAITAEAAKPSGGLDLLGAKLKSLVGSWDVKNAAGGSEEWVFAEDGSLTINGNGGARYEIKAKVAHVTFSTGNKMEIVDTSISDTFSGKHSNGSTFQLTRKSD